MVGRRVGAITSVPRCEKKGFQSETFRQPGRQFGQDP